ncbi:hypothetical protein EJ05DRAFT_473951 [Pseudovirgaria hyperparasitica]|uniref:Endonuclease/exonuclease/phosphatase domain-containing protein n=1 Tax=Pseudovirgaria hyperparasitica TaxID=470096 RepID=A0A6A6WFE7_9PEZI|nr:uncharacterized protein EJ05DRAFT_473951 [Pseudovirgaria hyperparasitica]KAF2761453.1 hypothetical protein EJ05DRAFT_473951 [Pseudovirgaria hyperparasitica]
MKPIPFTKAAFLTTLTLTLTTPGVSSQYTTTSPLSIPIRLITHNIRYAATSLFTNEAPWSTRRPLIAAELHHVANAPPNSLICLQEVLHNQVVDIHTDLNAGTTANTTATEWAYIGVGCDDGVQAGEYSPIFYRPSEWRLLSFRTVWLSETPDVPSKGWDAGSVRILTIGVFAHVATGRDVVAMCTHLDNQGTVSRLESAKLIIERINGYTGANGTGPVVPVLLAGDFNSEMGQEAYEEMSSAASPVVDLRAQVPEGIRYGNVNTFTDFTDDTGDDILIDFLWVGPNNASFWKVEGYAVLANKFDNGIYSSDHRAVVGDVVLMS